MKELIGGGGGGIKTGGMTQDGVQHVEQVIITHTQVRFERPLGERKRLGGITGFNLEKGSVRGKNEEEMGEAPVKGCLWDCTNGKKGVKNQKAK